MTPERWQQIDQLFEAALELEPGRWTAFLDQECAGDEEARREVESLLAAHVRAESFIETPAFEIAAAALADEQSRLRVGQSLGHYRILEWLGEGGMGEVYLAEDIMLGRRVALKLLPADFTSDAERLRRFKQEARTASALNHPNIITIHEIGQYDGAYFMATEFIDGMTLREKLSGGQLKLKEALDVAYQIVLALTAAHETKIIHRDIKPENIMLRGDGIVKVLDFGLAKLTKTNATALASEAPTKVLALTEPGKVMGTVAYMSPEQARGLELDALTDIWSVGVVLYEMATGRPPFTGETPSHITVAILEQEPAPIRSFAPDAPAELQRIVRKALTKDIDERYQTARDLLIDLKSLRRELDIQSEAERSIVPNVETLSAETLSTATAQVGQETASGSLGLSTGAVGRPGVSVKYLLREIKDHKKAALLTLTSIGCIALFVFAWFHSPHSTSEFLPPMKVVPFTSYPGNEDGAAFSPDGNQIAFVWSGEKNDNFDIYVKSIGSERPLRLTTDPNFDYGPTWSPDGQKIAFVRASESEFTIFVVPALGGSERRLLSLSAKVNWGGLGPDIKWSPDGKFIAYCDKASKQGPPGIFLFSPETGERHALTSPPAQYWGDFLPAFSPDGQTVAFLRWNNVLSTDLYLVPIHGGQPRRLTFDNAAMAGAAWTPDGREIIFSSSRLASMNFSGLWRIPVAGGTPERLPVAETRPLAHPFRLRGIA